MIPLEPREILPHGPGMQLLSSRGEMVDGWLTYRVNLSPQLSVLEGGGSAPPELGLEMMAQACGMLLAHEAAHAQPRVGVVGAVRNYTYSPERFCVGDEVSVRVRADTVSDTVVVCEGTLYRAGRGEPDQAARITLILMEE